MLQLNYVVTVFSIPVVNSNSLSMSILSMLSILNIFFHVAANILSVWMFCSQQSERIHPKSMQVGLCKFKKSSLVSQIRNGTAIN